MIGWRNLGAVEGICYIVRNSQGTTFETATKVGADRLVAFLNDSEKMIADQAKEIATLRSKPDWRVGLSCKPVMRTHDLHYERGTIRAVHPSGHGGLFDGNGVLTIEMQSGRTLLARSSEWMTA